MHFLQATHRGARWALLALSLSCASSAFAQPQPSAAAMATAKELITVTGANTIFNPLIAGVVEQAKVLYLQQDPALAKDLNEIAANLRTQLAPRFTELNDEVARLYTTDFTEQELKDILAFYKSPAGQKLLEQQPKVIDNSMKFAQTWANKLSDEVVAKMRDELKKRGHAL
ncbi:DUF2059 domain-containing protein [Pseudolabrys taiwanensis]|uniref:DUF2059 domain-containing protein n=1 Tax=Pseudolabrys taiwanensis TaxID=331696 RepID=A0A345ZUN0_9HYPH|nr:DUF2059 domain-containing protein [Pseudolabrys taiwanensis]AXK80627.1 DUF2059 domain-containing protein [Pseudolabrys taiwanensis]